MLTDLTPMLRANAEALERRHPGNGNLALSPLPAAVEVDPSTRPVPGLGVVLRAAASVVWGRVVGVKNSLTARVFGQEGLSRAESESLHLLAYYQTQGGGQMVVSGVFAEHAARRSRVYTVEAGVTDSIKIITKTTEPTKVVFERIVDGLDRNAEARERAEQQAATAATPQERAEVFRKDVLTLMDGESLRSARQEIAGLRAIINAPPDEISEALELFAAPGEKSPDVTRASKGFADLIELADLTLPINSDPAWGNRGDVTKPYPTATTNFVVIEHDADWEKVYAVQQALPKSLETEIAGCTLGTTSEREGWILFTKDASRAVAECVRTNAPAELLDATVQASALLRLAAARHAESSEVVVTRATADYLPASDAPAAPGEEPGQHL